MAFYTKPGPAEPVTEFKNDGNDLSSGQATRTLLRSGRPASSISQLPIELLISILQLSLPHVEFPSNAETTTSHLYMRMLYSIRLVSKQWQEIVDGTPNFWTVILSTFPSHVNAATIHRSAELPLAIVYEAPMEPNDDDHPSSEAFLQTIKETRLRWSVVVLDLYEEKSISGYIADPAPLLQTLVVRTTRDADLEVEQLEFLGGQTTNLRHVAISDASIQWRIEGFTQLKSLRLTRMRHNLTASRIVDFLRASPCLEELCIEGVLEPSRQISSPIITLPLLRSIELECQDSNATDDILRNIRAPSWIMFSVILGRPGEGDNFDYPRFLNETLSPFHETLLKLHKESGASMMSIHFYGFQWHLFTGRDQKRGFSIYMERFHPLGIRWVGRILQEEPGLRIELNDITDFGDAVLGEIAPLRCVTRVRVAVTEADGIYRIFRFLCQPLSPGASPPALPCLLKLVIASAGWNAQDLLDMVELRLSAFSKAGLNPPPLSINIWRGALTMHGRPRPILDLETLTKIRESEGIDRVESVGRQDADGTLAITWNEEASEPTRGQ